jgi:hypothetical protein
MGLLSVPPTTRVPLNDVRAPAGRNLPLLTGSVSYFGTSRNVPPLPLGKGFQVQWRGPID